jgi:hypothetical protein
MKQKRSRKEMKKEGKNLTTKKLQSEVRANLGHDGCCLLVSCRAGLRTNEMDSFKNMFHSNFHSNICTNTYASIPVDELSIRW